MAPLYLTTPIGQLRVVVTGGIEWRFDTPLFLN